MPAALNWLDYVVIAIILLCVIDCMVKGFIVSIFNIAGFFISLYAAKSMSPLLADYIAKDTGISDFLNKYLVSKASVLNPSAGPALKILGTGPKIESMLSSFIILIISFAILFIVVRFVLAVISSLLDIAARLPVLKQFNKAGGFVFGLIKGVIIVYLCFAILTPIIPLISPSNPIVTALNSSILAANFYKYNIIIPWVKGAVI